MIAGLLVVVAAALSFDGVFSAAAAATLGKPEPWQMVMQEPGTSLMRQVEDFHSFLLIIITLIVALVLGLLLVIILRFNSTANPVPSKITHNTLIEVVWTVVPIIILVAIAVPSFRLLYQQRLLPAADMTVKITGNKWYWSYEYPDHGGFSFDSNILSDEQADAKGEPRHLAVDNAMVIPVNKTVRVIVTASDVIHSWALPSYGQKVDAIPGRLNEDWFNVESAGVYYGQCSELCGKDHAFMPITVRAVSEQEFNAWAEKAKTAGIEEANKLIAQLPLERDKLAAAESAKSR
jgi:cytochrome c oxidase subunit 2